MVIVIQIQSGQAFNNFRRINKNFPIAAKKGLDDFGKSMVRSMKREITLKKLIWRGKLHSGVRWERSRSGGRLWMPIHGVYMDSMRPHWVQFKQTRTKLIQWAEQKGNLNVKIAAASKGGMFVRPRPFIDTVLKRRLEVLRREVKRHIKLNSQSTGRRT